MREYSPFQSPPRYHRGNACSSFVHRIAAFLFIQICSSLFLSGDVSKGIFLTWEEDPSSTMVIQWMEPIAVPSLTPVPEEEGRFLAEVPYLPDASLEKWPEGAFEVNLLVDPAYSLPDAEDLSAETRLAWNEKGLWVWMDVTDDVVWMKPESKQIGHRDFVEIHLSEALGSEERYQVVLSPRALSGDRESNWMTNDLRRQKKNGELEWEYRIFPQEHGYRLAVFLPWKNLQIDPGAGRELAMQISIHDLDSSNKQQVVSWHPSPRTLRNASAMMPLRLEEKAGMPHAFHAYVTARDGEAIVTVVGGPRQDGLELALYAGDAHLGRGKLKVEGGRSVATFHLPPPKEGTRWASVRIEHDGKPAAYAMIPEWIYAIGPLPAPMALSYGKMGEALTHSVQVEPQRLFMWEDRALYRVKLTGLEADTEYAFRIGDDERTYRFRTMPKVLNRPLRVAVGGDTLHRKEWMEAVNRQAMKHNPDFIVWGGDLAYADGRYENLHLWRDWFDVNMNTLITPEGRIVPVVLGIGNHEVVNGYYFNHREYEQTDEWRSRIAPYFYQLFSFPGQPGYAALDFGDYLSLVMLDTDHSNPVEGIQTEWLEGILRERQHFTHVWPVYHVPAYPPPRAMNNLTNVRIRENWVPLFEKYGVRLAFENHSHSYKRSHPIRENKVDPDGIVYFGDGAWGVRTNPVTPAWDTWYLARAESVRHAILVTIEGERIHVVVLDEEGNVIDDYRTSR